MPEGHSLRSLLFLALAWVGFLVLTVAMNQELLFAPGWWQGLLCGVGITWAWTRSPAVRTAGALLGVAALGAMAFGLIGAQQIQVRALFQGTAIGFPVAFLLVAVIQWRKTHAYLVARATAYDDAAGLRWLQRHRPRPDRKRG